MKIYKGDIDMNISPLQKARYEYAPKLPGMLRNGIADICVKEGAETTSVADQDKIKALFPNTYGKKEITFEKGQNTSEAKKVTKKLIHIEEELMHEVKEYL